jgi:hypothetical protein
MDYPKWFVGLFETPNGQRIGISKYYDEEEIKQINNAEILREKVLVSGLTMVEAEKEYIRLVEEMGIQMFDNGF